MEVEETVSLRFRTTGRNSSEPEHSLKFVSVHLDFLTLGVLWVRTRRNKVLRSITSTTKPRKMKETSKDHTPKYFFTSLPFLVHQPSPSYFWDLFVVYLSEGRI